MKALLVAVAAFVFAIGASSAVGGCSTSAPSSSPEGSGTATCTAPDGAMCPTGAGILQLCVIGNDQCTGAYFAVGMQQFNCNSCTDTTACEDQAAAVCYGDGGTGTSGGGQDAAVE